MARIYKRSDRIAVKIDDVTVKLAPLSLDQKAEIQMAMMHGSTKRDLKEMTHGIALSIKYSLKEIEGVVDGNDEPYQLQFEGDHLSEECVQDLMNMELVKKLTTVCSTFVNGVPASFNDAEGKPMIDGVELVKSSKDSDSKKT